MGERGRYPMGRAGNYVAPVDTTGMDEEMKATLIPKPRPKPRPASPAKSKKKQRGK